MSTPDPTPWEVIRAAADKIEKMAAEATPTPWTYGSGRTVVAVIPSLLTRMTRPWGLKIARDVCDVDREWITALSPAVAEPLVAWLRDAELLFEDDELYRRMRSHNVGREMPHLVPEGARAALVFARSVLGDDHG